MTSGGGDDSVAIARGQTTPEGIHWLAQAQVVESLKHAKGRGARFDPSSRLLSNSIDFRLPQAERFSHRIRNPIS